MSKQFILVLITKAPTDDSAEHAIRYVESAVQAEHDVRVFFYADGAMAAHNLLWQTADRKNLTAMWQQLAQNYQLELKVCVSTALARGVTDTDNAQRHGLLINNQPANTLADGFQLVGLTELMLLMDNRKIIQF